ncbi:DUF1345 domain-containing protein [Leucobacter luti]|uniref:Putative membrane protein n=1 Tax=Leucobacter luti TaxID=340320 RepID=A0A4Q7U629_9MICO|nr:DUF1345 domain-containing protein [Leucobacter luti]MBL3700605.1 DUF1345 domain-containing protein [Leucobacter luti]RZT68557.1 putative membrane protein [Leucobacter luti]
MSTLPVRAQLRLRWAVAIVAGIATGAAASPALGPAAGVLVGWGVLALVSTVWVLVQVWSMDAAATRAHATAEDPGHRLARVIAVAGSVVSLAAVVVVIVQARHASGAAAFVLAGIAVLSVVSSWALIQTNYLLHYARVYYDDGGDGHGDGDGETGSGSERGSAPAGGINFNQDADPCYVDFAYFSVGLGMTYQVSDTNVSRTEIRRIVIAQSLLAYLFGAGILAAVINLIAGLT